jgi:hypothetical protein
LVLKKRLSDTVVKVRDLGEVDNWCSNLRSDVDGSLLNLLDLVLDELLGFGFSSDKGIGNWAKWSLIFVVGGLGSGGNSLGLSVLLELLEVDNGVEVLGMRVHMPVVLGGIEEHEEGV